MAGELRPSTGIPKIDAEVEKMLQMKPRDITPIATLPEDFPSGVVKEAKGESSKIYVVGTGWDFPSAATALIAAGAKVIAYEKSPEKTAKGQLGCTMQDVYFNFGEVDRVCRLMPRLSSKQLERLPNIIKSIANHPSYRELMRKVEIAENFQRKKDVWKEKEMKYNSLHDSQKISKRELINVKEKVLEILKKAGVLKIVYQQVTIDLIQSWLEDQKPVFMISGHQVDLKRVGLEDLDGNPGFVKEFLLGTDATEGLIEMIRAKQRALKENGEQQAPLKVALIGGGQSASSCVTDFLKKVDAKDLEVIWIRPEEEKNTKQHPVPKAQKSENKEWIPGHISELVFSNNQKTIKSVKVFNLRESEMREIPCNLLVHTWNQDVFYHDQPDVIRKACQDITNLLDKKKPSNGLVRDRGIGPDGIFRDIGARITHPWTASLEDDVVLNNEIQALIKQEGGKNCAIVVTGKNTMIEAVMALAESLGYVGYWYQIEVPYGDQEVEQQAVDLQKRTECIWRDVIGRVVKEGTTVRNDKFSLSVCRSNDKKVELLTEIDGIINCAGKTRNTPLIQAMKERGYIGEKETQGHLPWTNLYSKHDRLFGHITILRPGDSEVTNTDGISLTIKPILHPRSLVQPKGWVDNFFATRQILCDLGISPSEQKS